VILHLTWNLCFIRDILFHPFSLCFTVFFSSLFEIWFSVNKIIYFHIFDIISMSRHLSLKSEWCIGTKTIQRLHSVNNGYIVNLNDQKFFMSWKNSMAHKQWHYWFLAFENSWTCLFY